MRGVYIHVPFCLQKCAYCDFYSKPALPKEKDSYVMALINEFRLKGDLWASPIDTLFFGGGTPSCLSLSQIATVLEECSRYFPLCDGAEVSMEINPDTVTVEDLRTFGTLGVNRLSIGLQASQNHLLIALGRSHDYAGFLRVVEGAKTEGFTNINVDVMYGVPGQSLQDYLETLRCVVDLGIPHLSCYGLQIEEHTPLALALHRGIVMLPDEEETLAMYFRGKQYLEDRGFDHYEISNFSLPGFQSRHNLKYWRNLEYIGFGPAAASFVSGRRFINLADTVFYCERLTNGRIPVGGCETLTPTAHRSETAILALRLLQEGIERQSFINRFGLDPAVEYAKAVDLWCKRGFLHIDAERITLTSEGSVWANQVQGSFLPEA